MVTPSIEDFAFNFKAHAKGWTAKNQILCKVAKIYHREGLLKFAELVDRPVEELEKGYALKATMQKKNRKRRGQKPLKRKMAVDYSCAELSPELLNWYRRKEWI